MAEENDGGTVAFAAGHVSSSPARKQRAARVPSFVVLAVFFTLQMAVYLLWSGSRSVNGIVDASRGAVAPVLPVPVRSPDPPPATERSSPTDESQTTRNQRESPPEDYRSDQVLEAARRSVADSGAIPAPPTPLLDLPKQLAPLQYFDCDVYQNAESTAMLQDHSGLMNEFYSRPDVEANDMSTNAMAEPPHSADQSSRFNVIVITFSRPKSLLRLLSSLLEANYSSATETLVHLEIYIDCAVNASEVDAETLGISRLFPWPHGPKTVLARRHHGGLFTQWIDTWQPKESSPDEHAIILEDDLQVSPHFYQWLCRVRASYGDRQDVAGYTLQKGRLRARPDDRKSTLHVDEKDPIFMYQLLGSWGFAPRRGSWTRFREWFETVRYDSSFKPYVDGLLPTEWYKKQEGKGTMWTMHYIYFCNQNRLFTVYANLPNRTTLGANWQEGGLHYAVKQSTKADFRPLAADEHLPEEIPKQPPMLDWSGHPIPDYYSPRAA